MRNSEHHYAPTAKRRRYEHYSPAHNALGGPENDHNMGGGGGGGGSVSVGGNSGGSVGTMNLNGMGGNDDGTGGGGGGASSSAGNMYYGNNSTFRNDPINFHFTASMPNNTYSNYHHGPIPSPHDYDPRSYGDGGSSPHIGRVDRRQRGLPGQTGNMAGSDLGISGGGNGVGMPVSNGNNMPGHDGSNPQVSGGSSIPSLIDPHMGAAASLGPRRNAFGAFGPHFSHNENPPSLPPLSLPPPTQLQRSMSYPTATNSSPYSNMNPMPTPPAPPPPLHPPPQGSYYSPRDNAAGRRPMIQARIPRSSQTVRRSHPLPASVDLAIRNIAPVREALALLKDSSPIMIALTQTVLQKGHVTMPPAERRNEVLNFKGFRGNQTPRTTFLTALSKSDLDILAWVFVVPKHGKKEELSSRIISSLRAPLAYRTPAVGKRPHIPARIEARPIANSISNNVTGARDDGAVTRAMTTSTQGRPFATSTVATSAADFTNTPPTRRNTALQMQNLTRELEPESSGVVPDLVALTSSTAPARTLSASMGRTKQMQATCYEVLQGYDFKDAENPFNEPLNEPLGDERFVFFSSTQLSRGTEDPILKFPTPPPISVDDNPKVCGGDVQIHLRCLRVEVEKPRTEWKQAWPFPASCRVNGHVVTLNQAQRYTNGKLAGRDAATNITGFLRKFCQTGLRSINKVMLRRQVSTASPAWGQYIMFAQEIIVHNHETMMNNVLQASEKYWQEYRTSLERKGELSANASDFEMARIGVKQFLNDPDGLQMESMKVSLRCPLALVRMSIPVKGRRCHHVQCFDLASFLEYSRRSSKFECPVCNKPTAYPSMLVKSPYIEHALREFSDCDDVAILTDGNMVAVAREQTGVASDDEDGESVIGNENNENKASATTRGPTANTSNPGNKVTEVVDLTLDSDDDGGPTNGPSTPLGDENGSGNGFDTDNGNENGNGNGNGNGEQGQDLDQDDIDFTFHADFCHWGEPPTPSTADMRNGNVDDRGGVPMASSTPLRNNARSNWACDVIAIDSD